MCFCGSERMRPALQRTAGGQLKRVKAAAVRPPARGAFERSTARWPPVDAVKMAERHSTALQGVDGRRTIYLHWAVSPFRKIVFSTLSTPALDVGQTRNAPVSSRRCGSGHRRQRNGSSGMPFRQVRLDAAVDACRAGGGAKRLTRSAVTADGFEFPALCGG